MNGKNNQICEHPEKLKDKPGKCSPEQIEECHRKQKKYNGESENKKKGRIS